MDYSLGGGMGEVRPTYSEWGEGLREALGCLRVVTGTFAPKNSAPRSGCQKAPRGPETGGLYVTARFVPRYALRP